MSDHPEWEYVANLGDKNPIDHGGLFVYRDKTGVYDPRMEKLRMDNPEEFDEDKQRFTVYRVGLERCYWDGTILSNNEFHKDHSVWWADALEMLANQFDDMTVDDLARKFCSDDPEERAWAYETVYDYYGWVNGDDDPLTELTRATVEERYKDCNPT